MRSDISVSEVESFCIDVLTSIEMFAYLHSRAIQGERVICKTYWKYYWDTYNTNLIGRQGFKEAQL